MNWIIWREYRLNRLILDVGLGLFLLPYAIALTALWWAEFPPRAFELFGVAALYSLVLAQLTVVLLGGNAIAGERNDRSAQFVAYLPLSRPRRLAGKLSLIAVTTIVLWGVNLLILLVVFGTGLGVNSRLDNLLQGVLFYSAITGLVFFGVAWLISSLQSSPTFAVCGALITPLVIMMGLQGVAWAIGLVGFADNGSPAFQRFLEIGYTAVSLILAALGFSIGTWYFLRRVEP